MKGVEMSGAMQSVERFAAKAVAAINRMYTTRPILLMGAIGLSILLLISILVSATTPRMQPSAVEYDETSETLPVPATKPQPPAVNTVSSSSTTNVNQSSTSPSNSASSHTTASVEVNGKSIPVPSGEGKTVHRKYRSNDGSNKTSIDITVKSSPSSSDSSSFNLDIQSDQSSMNNTE